MLSNFNNDVFQFIEACNFFKVRMILVGGSAVNYYGYKRHSADIDFWVERSPNNLGKLKLALNRNNYIFDSFPEKVLKGKQNISLKFSPDVEIELIMNFDPGKTFEEAFNDSEKYEIKGQDYFRWRILSFEDLVNSKIKSGRPKDLLDVMELKRIK